MATNTSRNNKCGIKVAGPTLPDVHASIRTLLSKEVLVGIPADAAERPKAEADEPNNAMLGYVHEHGMPEQNIPARPFLAPGVRSVSDQIVRAFHQMATEALKGGGPDRMDKMFHAVGMLTSSAVKNYIDAGIGPPLADLTVARRAARGREGAQLELDNRAKGEAPSLELAKPLVDTGELRKSINYVVVKRRRE